MTIDLSRFKKDFKRDSEEDLKKIAATRFSKRIGEGLHEVIVKKIAEKDGVKLTLKEFPLAGTALVFSLVVNDAQDAEQTIFMAIPIAHDFMGAITASKESKKESYTFKKSLENIERMGLNPANVRESLIFSNGAASEYFIGTQFTVYNSWSMEKCHLKYDSNDKTHYLVNGAGIKFDGALGGPYHLNIELDISVRYNEIEVIAKQNHLNFQRSMDTEVRLHPTASNDGINQKFAGGIEQKPERKPPVAPKVLNKTESPFANRIKPATVPEDLPF